MSSDSTDLLLYELTGKLTTQKSINNIISLNDKTEKYNLSLTEAQAVELIETKTMMLKETERIEFGGNTVEDIIKAFCDSPYLDRRNYELTLHSLIELFYTIKDETHDIVSDKDIIKFMKTCFNGICGGSMNALEGDCVPKLIRHINSGKKFNSFKIGN